MKYVKNAWMMENDFGIFLTNFNGDFVFSWVWDLVNDWKTFYDPQGRCLNSSCTLNSPVKPKSNFKNMWVSWVLVWLGYAAFLSKGTRVCILICIWVIRSKKIDPKSMNWWIGYLIFHAIIFKSFHAHLVQIMANLARFFPNLIIHNILRLFHAQKDSKN